MIESVSPWAFDICAVKIGTNPASRMAREVVVPILAIFKSRNKLTSKSETKLLKVDGTGKQYQIVEAVGNLLDNHWINIFGNTGLVNINSINLIFVSQLIY